MRYDAVLRYQSTQWYKKWLNIKTAVELRREGRQANDHGSRLCFNIRKGQTTGYSDSFHPCLWWKNLADKRMNISSFVSGGKKGKKKWYDVFDLLLLSVRRKIP